MLRLSQLARSALTLGAGTAAGQVMVVLATPIWSRLYTSADFGRLGMFLSFLGTATVGVALRYDLAIPLGPDRKEASILLWLCILIISPMSVVLGLVLCVLCEFGWLGFGALPSWSGFVAMPLLAAAGLFTALRFWHVGMGEFSEIGRSLAFQGAGRAVTPILLAWLQPGWIGLVAGEAMGRFFGIRRLSLDAIEPMRVAIRSTDVLSMRATARSYRRFPAVFLPSAVLDAASSSIVVPLFVMLFGVSAGGEFLLAQQVVVVPSALLCASLADVYHRRLIAQARAGTVPLNSVVIHETWRLLQLGMLTLAPIGILAFYAASPILGSGWERVGALVLLLVPSAIVGIATGTLSRVLVVSTIPQLKFVADAIKLVVPTAAMIAAQRFGYDVYYSVAMYSGALALSQAVYLFIMSHAVKAEYRAA